MKHLSIIAAILLLACSVATAGGVSLLDRIDRAVASGNLADARDLAVQDTTGSGHRWLVAYVDAYILLKSGRAKAAERIARKIVAEDGLAVRRRHLLINVLIAERKYRQAVYHIRRNLRRVRDPRMRQEYERLLKQYDKSHPISGTSLSVGANPSTNTTQGTSQGIVYLNGLPFSISPDLRKRAGATVNAGLYAYRNFVTGENSEIVASTTANLEAGVKDNSKNLFTLAPELLFVLHMDNATLWAGPVAEFQWSKFDPYAVRLGGVMGASYVVSPRDVLALRMRATSQTYPDYAYMDGYKFSAGATWSRQLTSSLSLDLGAQFEREKTRAPHLTYNGYRVRAGMGKTWQNGLFTDISVAFEDHSYTNPFPLTGVARKDREFEIQAGFSYEKLSLFGIVPYVGLRYTKHASNVALYDYDSKDLILGGKRQF